MILATLAAIVCGSSLPNATLELISPFEMLPEESLAKTALAKLNKKIKLVIAKARILFFSLMVLDDNDYDNDDSLWRGIR